KYLWVVGKDLSSSGVKVFGLCNRVFGRTFMRRFLVITGIAVTLSTVSSTALAASPGTQGHPSQSCQSFFGDNGPFTPAGFNTAGFNHATTVYAGAQPQNSSNPKSVSQYDVACFQASQRP